MSRSHADTPRMLFVEQRLETFVSQTHLGLIGSLIIGLVTAAMLWDEGSQWRVLWFLAGVASTMVVRGAVAFGFAKQRKRLGLLSWEWLCVLSVVYSGLVWGLAAWWVAPEEFAQRVLVLPGVLFLAAGASHYTLARPWAIPLTSVLLLAPVGINFAVHDSVADRALAVLILVFLVAGTRLIRQSTDNARLTHALSVQLNDARQEAETLARTDFLTGLCNRRAFYETGEQLFRVATRHDEPLSVVVFDVDRFKAINDTHGHAVGDKVLQTIGRAVTQVCRESDLAGRLGGEEFAVLLPRTPLDGAGELAQRLRACFEQQTMEGADDVPDFTASLGVAARTATCTSLEMMVVAADAAMYRAKRQGRNQVELATVKEPDTEQAHELSPPSEPA